MVDLGNIVASPVVFGVLLAITIVYVIPYVLTMWGRPRLGSDLAGLIRSYLVLYIVFVGSNLLFTFALGNFDAAVFARFNIYIIAVLATGLIRNRAQGRLRAFAEVAFILALWIPLELDLAKGAWRATDTLNLAPLTASAAVLTAYFVAAIGDGRDRIGLPMANWGQAFRVVLPRLLFFCVLSIPIGLMTDFLTINVRVSALKAFTTPLWYFFFVAFPEELLFRGLIQRFCVGWSKSPRAGLIVASVIFGLSHFNNDDFGDLRYVFLASVAGLFYGSAYIKTRNLLAPTLLHTLVDSLWILFLHR